MKSNLLKSLTAVLVSLFTAVAVTGCINTDNAFPQREITLIAYDSFVLDPAVKQQFEDETGYIVNVVLGGDANELVNKLILTKDQPIADIVYGIDNFNLVRANREGIFESGTSSVEAIARGDVCLNRDVNSAIHPPTDYEDLASVASALVLEDPNTSSPGFVFWAGMAYNSIATPYQNSATIGDLGLGDLNNAAQLLSSYLIAGAKIDSGWSEAYYDDFTQGGADGKFPLVVSYASSPAATPAEDGKSSLTEVLDWSCVQVTESAGVLSGATNPEGARSLLKFLLEEDYQRSLPETLYLYPIQSNTALPENWAKFAQIPPTSIEVDSQWAFENREKLLQAWDTAVKYAQSHT
jgi:thiamine transport system substrate-binding protein